MKKLLLLLFLIPNLVMALPPCLDGNSIWNECIGTETNPDGSKYVGEYKKGEKHGQGTLILADGADGSVAIANFGAGKILPLRI